MCNARVSGFYIILFLTFYHSVLSISVTGQSDPVIYIYIYIYSLSHIILHHVPSQATGYSSLCYISRVKVLHCLFLKMGEV